MSESLLQTKLYTPPLRPNLVSRPRLISRLNQGLHQGRQLTLVSAPAGFGKSTLVSEWLVDLRPPGGKQSQSGTRIAWLSLDENDNDLARFLEYIIIALNRAGRQESNVGQGSLSMLRSPQPPSAGEILAPLINEISNQSGRIVLILDDYHVIDSAQVDDVLAFLLDHLPPQLHLVIATREDPHLPLARLRAGGQLTELRAVDLRFSNSEAADFLRQSMGLDLSKEDVAALEASTEGWIAGLQLAAISMQGRDDAANFIAAFTGTHRYVLDYLIEEVLGRQSESTQTFLLHTATLDRLSGSLCDALTRQDNGQATLEKLEHTNLFIVCLDDERRWYRYHHLFADLLRQRLQQTQPNLVPLLNRRASEWCEKNGYIAEAVEYALRASDYEQAAHLIEKLADTLWQLGQHTKLLRWFDALPTALVLSKPSLCILQAWDLFANGQQDAAEQCLAAAERVLADNSGPTTGSSPARLADIDAMKLQGRIATVRAFLAFYRGDTQAIYSFSHQALEHLPEQDLTWRSAASIALGDAYGFIGEMAPAYRFRSEAVRTSKMDGNVYMTLIASMKLAVTMRQQGKLLQVIEICRQQSKLAEESGLSQTAVFGFLLSVWGEVLAEVNDLDEAILRARRGAELTRHGRDLVMVGWSSICLTRVLYSIGDLGGAEEVIVGMERLASGNFIPPWIIGLIAVWQAKIWLAQDDLQAASRWVAERGLAADGTPSPSDEMAYIVLARLLIAQDRLGESASLLERLLLSTGAGGRISRMLEVQILQAIAYHEMGDLDRAMSTMALLLPLAKGGNYVRCLADERRPMQHLLYEASIRGIASDYARRILAVIQSIETPRSDEATVQADQSDLIEPLSTRELEVLQLIGKGLTNKEIASTLYLSLNTVKVHTRNIYGKLNVHSRAQAIARSQELGLLSRL